MPGRRDTDDFADDVAGSVVESILDVAGSVVPGAGPLTKRLVGKVREEVRRHRSTAILAAVAASGLSREDLAEAIAADARLVPLATRLLYAAGMNGHDRTLKAMGAALGDAVNRRESIGECELILTALTDLTDSHAAVLALVAQDVPGETDQERRSRWSREALTEASGLGDRVVTLCTAALVARGLVRMPGAMLGGGNSYQITELGRLVLDVLDLYLSE